MLKKPLRVYAVPRGGIPVALSLQRWFVNLELIDDVDGADIVVDDLIDRRADATAIGQATFAILLVIGAIPALWTGWRARRSDGAEPWPH